MRLRAYQRLGDPEPINREVSVVVIENAAGDPVMVACDVGNGAITAAHVGDPDFNRVLQTLGFNKLVVAETIDHKLSRPEDLPLLTGR